MKLEAGKYYKTRDGRKAYVAAVGCPFGGDPKNDWHVIGWIDDFVCQSWSADGFWIPGTEDGHDLIAEWREPIVKEVTLYMSENGGVSPFLSPLHDRIIAKKTVTITECEGL